jgi:hypothetical protein
LCNTDISCTCCSNSWRLYEELLLLLPHQLLLLVSATSWALLPLLL